MTVFLKVSSLQMVSVHLSDMTEMAMVVAFCFTSAKTYQQKSSTVIFQLPKVFFVEINLHKKKLLINCPCNPHKNNIGSHLNVITKALDTYYGKYENVVLLGDLNAGIEETTMKSFCESYNLIDLIKQPTCFKNPEKPSCIDLILTNRPKSFQSTCVIETGLSDFHRMTVSVLKMHFRKLPPNY